MIQKMQQTILKISDQQEEKTHVNKKKNVQSFLLKHLIDSITHVINMLLKVETNLFNVRWEASSSGELFLNTECLNNAIFKL